MSHREGVGSYIFQPLAMSIAQEHLTKKHKLYGFIKLNKYIIS